MTVEEYLSKISELKHSLQALKDNFIQKANYKEAKRCFTCKYCYEIADEEYYSAYGCNKLKITIDENGSCTFFMQREDERTNIDTSLEKEITDLISKRTEIENLITEKSGYNIQICSTCRNDKECRLIRSRKSDYGNCTFFESENEADHNSVFDKIKLIKLEITNLKEEASVQSGYTRETMRCDQCEHYDLRSICLKFEHKVDADSHCNYFQKNNNSQQKG